MLHSLNELLPLLSVSMALVTLPAFRGVQESVISRFTRKIDNKYRSIRGLLDGSGIESGAGDYYMLEMHESEIDTINKQYYKKTEELFNAFQTWIVVLIIGFLLLISLCTFIELKICFSTLMIFCLIIDCLVVLPYVVILSKQFDICRDCIKALDARYEEIRKLLEQKKVHEKKRMEERLKEVKQLLMQPKEGERKP